MSSAWKIPVYHHTYSLCVYAWHLFPFGSPTVLCDIQLISRGFQKLQLFPGMTPEKQFSLVLVDSFWEKRQLRSDLSLSSFVEFYQHPVFGKIVEIFC